MERRVKPARGEIIKLICSTLKFVCKVNVISKLKSLFPLVFCENPQCDVQFERFSPTSDLFIQTGGESIEIAVVVPMDSSNFVIMMGTVQ